MQKTFSRRILSIAGKVVLFFGGYFATVLATLTLSQALWPGGLPHNAQFIFWPASGVALYFTLRFGPAYAPSMLLAVIPAVLFAGEPPLRGTLGALGNVLEAWVAWAVLVKIGKFDGRIDSLRGLAALTAATILGGITASVSYPLLTTLGSGLQAASWDSTLIRYAFANSCGSMIVMAGRHCWIFIPARTGSCPENETSGHSPPPEGTSSQKDSFRADIGV